MVKIKLTLAELREVYNSIYPVQNGFLEVLKTKQYREAIVYFMMLEVRLVIAKKLVLSKPKYSLSLTYPQACWLISYYQYIDFDPNLHPYMNELFRRVISEIDKQLTNYKIQLK
jgi:hypothetical protein